MKTLAAFILLLIPSPAFSQDAPLVEVRTAVGASHYLHGDLDYTAPTLLVALRLGRAALAVEPEFALSSHEEVQTFGPDTSVTSGTRFQSVAVNVVGRSRARVSVYGGGGVGVYAERRRYRLDDPVYGYEDSRTQGPRLGAQAMAGVDVPVAGRLKAFGQFRYEVRSFEDPGGGSVVQGMGGIAVALW